MHTPNSKYIERLVHEYHIPNGKPKHKHNTRLYSMKQHVEPIPAETHGETITMRIKPNTEDMRTVLRFYYATVVGVYGACPTT